MKKTGGLYLGIGVAAGFFGGLVGLGGGIVMVPMLARAGLSQQRAHGTSLAALVFTGIAGAATYAYSGTVDFWAAGALASTAVLSAGAGARSAHRLPADKLKRYFGIFQLAIAALLFTKPWLIQGGVPGFWFKLFCLLAAGAFTGYLSGMMGVGGGSIMVPAMVLLTGMGQHVAQGSALLAMVPAGIAGASAHHRLGNVAGGTLWWLLPGIMMGTFAGGMAAAAIDADWLRVIFALVLVYVGTRYAMSRPPGKGPLESAVYFYDEIKWDRSPMKNVPIDLQKNPYTLLGDQKVIIDYAAIYCRTPQDLLKSSLFNEILARFIRRIEKKRSPGYLFLRERRPDLKPEEIPDFVLRLLRLLVGHGAKEILELHPAYGSVLNEGYDREWIYELRRDLYNYWRRFERYIFLEMPHGSGQKSIDIYHDQFISGCEDLRDLVLRTNRIIGEHLSGKDPKVYRQLPAGANMAMLLERIDWKCPDYLKAFKDVPFIRITLIEPPLILYSKSNTRKGIFLEIPGPHGPIAVDPSEWFCFPAKVGELTAFIFFHHDYIAQALSMANLFELAEFEDIYEKTPDIVVLFGVPPEGMKEYTEFFEDRQSGIITGMVQRNADVGYFGYFKKMTLTLHNVAMLNRGRLPLHGAMMHIKLKEGGYANIAFVGDSGAGKSETLEALRAVAEEYFSDIKVIFDDMGSFAIGEDGRVHGYGTEIGAFVRLDDLQPKYAYDEVDRSIFINPDKKNARLIMPITAYHHVVMGYPVDMLFYANNYEALDDAKPAVEFFTRADEALAVFRDGTRLAKGTTDEKGLVRTYFANPFGAQQRQAAHEKVAVEVFKRMFETGVRVGQVRTRLGIPGFEQEGPKAVALKLYDLLKELARQPGR